MEKNYQISSAMILAAGLGERIRSVSNGMPKPLIQVCGRPLIEYSITYVVEFGIKKLIVNTHYKADLIKNYLQSPRIISLTNPSNKSSHKTNIKTIHEIDRLETGGGVKNAIYELGHRPFFVINSDSIFGRESFNPLSYLAEVWDNSLMDVLLLVCPLTNVKGYNGSGDFNLEYQKSYGDSKSVIKNNIAYRAKRLVDNDLKASFVFTGIQILSPKIFNNAPDGSYSLNFHYDDAIANERLYAINCDETWYHVGSPDGLRLAEKNVFSRKYI